MSWNHMPGARRCLVAVTKVMTMHSRHSLTVLVGWAVCWAPPKVAVQLRGNNGLVKDQHHASLGAKILSVPGETGNYYCAVLQCLEVEVFCLAFKERAAKACEIFLQ